MPGVTIVGLGPGDPNLLTIEARHVLAAAAEVHTRTARHPALATLPPSTPVIAVETPPADLVQELLALARRPQGVVYAVPGHPSGRRRRCRRPDRRLPPREPALPGRGRRQPPGDGLRGPGHRCRRRRRAAHRPTGPAAGPRPAGAARSSAGGAAPAGPARQAPGPLPGGPRRRHRQHRRLAARATGGGARRPGGRGASGRARPPARTGGQACLYLPALAPERNFRTFGGLEAIVHRLRAPNGCPWDRAQTHESLRRFLLEEAYETLAALDEGDPGKLREELGDLLLQVLLHTEIASESGEFRLADVVESIGRKLVRRHPHVFGDVRVETPEEVVDNWEAIKRDERAGGRPLLADVPAAMPALAYSQALQSRASTVGFQWPDVERVLEKLVEELEELSKVEDAAARRDEMGDVLFVLTSVARSLGVDAEEALRLAARKFRERFTRMEALAQERGRDLAQLSLSEMEALWQEAKAAGGSDGDPAS